MRLNPLISSESLGARRQVSSSAQCYRRLWDFAGPSLLWRSLQTSDVSEAFRWKGMRYSRMEGVSRWVEHIPGAFGSLSCPWRGNPASQKQDLLLLRLHRRQEETLSLGISIGHLFWLVYYREINQKPTDEWEGEGRRGRGRGRGREKFFMLTSCWSKLGETHLCRQSTGLLPHNSLVRNLSGKELERDLLPGNDPVCYLHNTRKEWEAAPSVLMQPFGCFLLSFQSVRSLNEDNKNTIRTELQMTLWNIASHVRKTRTRNGASVCYAMSMSCCANTGTPEVELIA